MGQSFSCLQDKKAGRRLSDENDVVPNRPRDFRRPMESTQQTSSTNVVESPSITASVASEGREQSQIVTSDLSQGQKQAYNTNAHLVESTISELECVMCLDTFSEDNPKVRTLCDCGVNRTNFHLSCLYEWTARNTTCPSCRSYLYFEED